MRCPITGRKTGPGTLPAVPATVEEKEKKKRPKRRRKPNKEDSYPVIIRRKLDQVGDELPDLLLRQRALGHRHGTEDVSSDMGVGPVKPAPAPRRGTPGFHSKRRFPLVLLEDVPAIQQRRPIPEVHLPSRRQSDPDVSRRRTQRRATRRRREKVSS